MNDFIWWKSIPSAPYFQVPILNVIPLPIFERGNIILIPGIWHSLNNELGSLLNIHFGQNLVKKNLSWPKYSDKIPNTKTIVLLKRVNFKEKRIGMSPLIFLSYLSSLFYLLWVFFLIFSTFELANKQSQILFSLLLEYIFIKKYY